MTSYADDYLEGFLYKRGKEDGKFLQRKFVLSSVEGTLKYFIKEVSLPFNFKINLLTFSINRQAKHRKQLLKLFHPM